MPGSTPRHSLSYPIGSDPAGQGDTTFKTFAESVDEKLDTRRFSPTGLKHFKNIAGFEENAASLTGFIVIQTNHTLADLFMMRIDIRGYTYSPTNNIIDMSISGYGYGPDTMVYSVDVNNRGTCTFSDVRWSTRNSDSKVAIIIAAPEGTGSTWHYPKMVVDAYFGYTEATKAKTEGWSISRVAAATVTSDYTTRVNADHGSWRTLTLANSWVNYAGGFLGARYKKIGNMVFVEGLVKDGLATYHIGTLPVGFRPSASLIFPAVAGGNTMGRVDVRSDGLIVHSSGSNTYFSLSNIAFPVDA